MIRFTGRSCELLISDELFYSGSSSFLPAAKIWSTAPSNIGNLDLTKLAMVWMALVACSALSPASFMSRSMSSCITMNIEKQYYRSRGKAGPKVIPKC